MELPKNRETLLKLGAAAALSLLVLDKLVLGPAIDHWKEQSDRIDELEEKVTRGRQLMERAQSLRERWDEMQRTDLPDDHSQAENDALSAVGHWEADSRISFTNFAPQWRKFEESGYETYEIRAAASGEQLALAQLMYELETDKLPVRLSDWELSARDAQGKTLNLSLRFSFVHLLETARRGR